METSLIRHPKAIAANTANSTAFLFKTGSAPGSPRQTGHTFVFGGSPKRVEHEQKIFDAVSSCTWTSSPITASYLAIRSEETAAGVAIPGNYIRRIQWSDGRPRLSNVGTAALGCPAERSAAPVKAVSPPERSSTSP